MKNISTVIVVFGTVLFFISCKKDHVAPSAPSCKIIAKNSNGIDFTLTYNSNGSIQSMGYNNVKYSYDYAGNKCTATCTVGGNFANKSSYTTNAAGFTTLMHTQFDIGNNSWSERTYEYIGNQVSKQISTSSTNPVPLIINYSWKNGNLDSYTYGGITTTYSYYTDKPSAIGDYFKAIELNDGYHIYDNKNQLKSIIYNNTDITNISYTYDQQNKITEMVINYNSLITKSTYSYLCP